MRGSEFVQQFAKRGYPAWEAAAVEMFRSGDVPPNPWMPIALAATTPDGVTHTAVAQVSADYLKVGTEDDPLLIPLTPSKAQEILNLDGSLLPTPFLDYQIWRQSHKLERRGSGTWSPPEANKGGNLEQYARHNAIVQQQMRGWDRQKPVSGHKKDIVVSNIYKPNTVLIHGWYKPAPDVFDDKQPWDTPDKQPQQANSNAHYAEYVDYSHGARKVHPMMVVDGKEMKTEDVYRHPELWRLVSHEGPLRFLRYPARNQPADYRPVHSSVYPVPTEPGFAWQGYLEIANRALKTG